MTFLQNNYERETAGSQYLKLQPNESATIRIISKAVEGLETWIDNKPVRWLFDGEMPKKAYKSEDKVRPFAAFNVWHYEESKFKIYCCATRSILQELTTVAVSRDSKYKVASNGERLIESAIQLIEEIYKNYEADTAGDLERRLINSIRNRDTKRFRVGIKRATQK